MTKNRHILLLNQTFYPDTVATAQLFYDLGSNLVENGYRVSVLCSRACYGLRGTSFAKRENISGVDVYRVGTNIASNKHIFGRLLNSFIFFVLVFFKGLRLNPDLLICGASPPMVAALARVMVSLKHVPMIYWVMDIYPDVAVRYGVLKKGSNLARILGLVSKKIYRSVEANVVLGRCMQQYIAEKEVDLSKVQLIPLWSVNEISTHLSNSKLDEPHYRKLWNIEDKFVVMYSGNLGIGHDEQTMCDVMLHFANRSEIVFCIVGGGKRYSDVQNFVNNKNLANVLFFPPQPLTHLTNLLTAADLHLISLRQEYADVMVPSKFYGILSAKRPMLFIGPQDSETAYQISDFKLGACFNNGDVDGIVQYLEQSIKHPPRIDFQDASLANSRTASLKKWKSLIESILKIKKDL